MFLAPFTGKINKISHRTLGKRTLNIKKNCWTNNLSSKHFNKNLFMCRTFIFPCSAKHCQTHATLISRVRIFTI